MAKSIVVTYGRFNPPTAGHHLLAQEVMRQAGEMGADHMIYGSMSADPKKNPLTPEQKAMHMERVLGTPRVHVGEGARNPFEMLHHLSQQGYDTVHMVLGSDRADEGIFNKMKQYVESGELPGVGKLGIKRLTGSTAGAARSDDAKGLAGVSGTKQRAFVSAGDFAGFRKGLPGHVSEEHARELFDDVMAGMQGATKSTPKKKVAKKAKKKLRENLYFGPLSFVINSLITEAEKQPTVKRKTSQNTRKRAQRANDEAKKGSGDLTQYMIVSTDDDKVQIIAKSSFDRRIHTIEVEPKKMNSGAIQNAIKKKNFRQTETSIRLVGKLEKEEKKEKSGTKKKPTGSTKKQKQEQTPTPAPVKIPKVTKGGKSIYPDDDHGATDIEFGVVALFNQMKSGMSLEDQIKAGVLTPAQSQKLATSQTLGSAGQRIVAQIIQSLPKGNWVAVHTGGKKDQPITKEWKASGGSDNTPKADLILENKNTGETIRASVKCGQAQLMSGKTPETSGTFVAALKIAEQMGNLRSNTQRKVKSVLKRMRENLAITERTEQGPVGLYTGNIATGRAPGSRFGQDRRIKRVEEFHVELTREIEKLFEDDEDFAAAVVFESMTGSTKFGEGGLATASHVLSVNKDGTNATLTPITWEYAKKVAKAMKIGIRFKSSPQETKDLRAKWNALKKKFSLNKKKMTEEDDFRPYQFWSAFRIEVGPKQLSEMSKYNILSVLFEKKEEEIIDPQSQHDREKYLNEAEQWIGDDPIKLMFFLDVDIDEISTPNVDFTDFAENNSGLYNTIIINGKEIEIPVQKDMDISKLEVPNGLNDDSIENYMKESYIQRALNFLLEKRNYRKEYDNYQGRSDQIEKRSSRNKARRLLKKMGRVRDGDGKDVDHKNGNPKDNSVKNLRVTSKSHNRSKR